MKSIAEALGAVIFFSLLGTLTYVILTIGAAFH